MCSQCNATDFWFVSKLSFYWMKKMKSHPANQNLRAATHYYFTKMIILSIIVRINWIKKYLDIMQIFCISLFTDSEPGEAKTDRKRVLGRTDLQRKTFF